MFAGGIDGGVSRPFMAVGRGDIDDAAALLGGHHTKLVLEAEQRPQHVGIERGGITLSGLVDDQAGLPFGTGDVDRYVEVAEAGHGLVDQAADFVIVTDISLDEDGFRAELLQFDFEGLALGRAATGNNQTSATFGKCKGGGATDAGESTSDEDDGLVHDLTPVRYN